MWEGGAAVENMLVREAQGNHCAALERPVNRGKSETNQRAGASGWSQRREHKHEGHEDGSST